MGLRSGQIVAGLLYDSAAADTHEKYIWEEPGRGAGRKGMVFHWSRQETCPGLCLESGELLKKEGWRWRTLLGTLAHSEVEIKFTAFNKLPSHNPVITQNSDIICIKDFCPASEYSNLMMNFYFLKMFGPEPDYHFLNPALAQAGK